MNANLITKLKKYEEELTLSLKCILDKDANFVRPLSEFWKGCTPDETPLFGCYGLWISGEGGSKINGQDVANFHDPKTFRGSYEMKKFMEDHNLYLEWYDPGTIVIFFKWELKDDNNNQ